MEKAVQRFISIADGGLKLVFGTGQAVTIKTNRGNQTHRDLLSYIHFYRFVESNIKNFLIVAFDSLIQRPEVFLSKIAEKLSLNVTLDELRESVPNATKSIREYEISRGEPPTGSAMPLDEKMKELEELRIFIRTAEYSTKLAECERLYERLTMAL